MRFRSCLKLFLVIFLSAYLCYGCSPISSKNDIINISGIVKLSSKGIPVSDATVSIGGHAVKTDETGKFTLIGLNKGTYILKVSKKGFNTYAVEKEFNSDNNDLEVNLVTILEVLHFSDSIQFNNYQYAVVLYPAKDEVINSASIFSPSSVGHDLIFEEGRFHCWWNDKIFEPGVWKLYVDLGTEEVVNEFTVENIDFSNRPTLLEPTDLGTIDTTTPVLKFTLSEDVDKVYIRIKDAELGQSSEQWLESNIDTKGEFKVPEGILEKNKEYIWCVHTVRGGDISVLYESLSDRYSFKVK